MSSLGPIGLATLLSRVYRNPRHGRLSVVCQVARGGAGIRDHTLGKLHRRFLWRVTPSGHPLQDCPITRAAARRLIYRHFRHRTIRKRRERHSSGAGIRPRKTRVRRWIDRIGTHANGCRRRSGGTQQQGGNDDHEQFPNEAKNREKRASRDIMDQSAPNDSATPGLMPSGAAGISGFAVLTFSNGPHPKNAPSISQSSGETWGQGQK